MNYYVLYLLSFAFFTGCLYGKKHTRQVAPLEAQPETTANPEMDTELHLGDVNTDTDSSKVIAIEDSLVGHIKPVITKRGTLEVFYSTPTGHIYHRIKSRFKDDGRSEWSEPTKIDAHSRSELSVLEAPDGRLFLYYTDILHYPGYTWQANPKDPESWVRPQSLQGTATKVHAINSPSGETHLFRTTSSGKIFVHTQPTFKEPGYWSEPQQLKGRASLISAAYTPDNRLGIFYIGVGELFWVPTWIYNNSLQPSSFAGLYFQTRNKKTNKEIWSGEQQIGKMLRYVTALNEQNHVTLYTIGSSFRIWVYRYDEKKKIHKPYNTGYYAISMVPLRDQKKKQTHLLRLSFLGEMWFNDHRLGGKASSLHAVIDKNNMIHVFYIGMVTKKLYYFSFCAPDKGPEYLKN